MSRFLSILILANLYSCGDEPTDDSESSANEDTNLTTVDVRITGALTIADGTDADLEGQKIQLKDQENNVIAQGFAESDGQYTFEGGNLLVPQGAVVRPKKSEGSASTAPTAGTTNNPTTSLRNPYRQAPLTESTVAYRIESVIEGDGSEKVLAVNHTLDFTSNKITDSVLTVPEQTFEEVAAITGVVKFVTPDGSENTQIAKTGTEVYLLGVSFFAKTGSDGKFLLLYIPPDDYTLRIEKSGFFVEKTVTVNPGETLALGTVEVSTDTTPPITTASLDSTDFRTATCVALTANETATTYHTTDGSNPSVSETFKYDTTTTQNCGAATCTICLKDKTTVLKFFSVDSAGNAEPMKSNLYFYNEKWADPDDTTAPTVTATVQSDGEETYSGSNLYTTKVHLALTTNEGATIYYTTDGSDPTTSSTVQTYAEAIAINSSATVKYFAKDYAANLSAIATKVVNIASWSKYTGSSYDLGKVQQCYATYDSTNRKTVVWVTNINGTSASDVWEYSSDSWTKVLATASSNLSTSSISPKPIFFSPTSGKVYTALVDDAASKALRIWEYAGSNWTNATSDTSTTTSNCTGGNNTVTYSLAYHGGLNRLYVIYGDQSSMGGTCHSNTIPNVGYYDPATGAFTYVGTVTGMPLTLRCGYNTQTGKIECLSSGTNYEMWTTSDGATWSQTTLSEFPASGNYDLAYDPGFQTLLLYGGDQGSHVSDQLWRYDQTNTRWTLVDMIGNPGSRKYHCMVHDHSVNKTLLIGGQNLFSYFSLGLWRYGY